MNKQVIQEREWVNLYIETQDAGYVCRRWGISRPTLRKWYLRYLEEGEKGLNDKSKRPLSSPNQNILIGNGSAYSA
ncbi:transposase (ISmav2) [Legionella santicrucis]|uniref:Transposase (ISmav2) n=1 Tax=Legionella santicrucis TaxID=45074 RepID=A0A0W0Z3A0_9GAMM|nr:helix-turn-helix domain-containing protein [Legionella santicrucis]KTD63609.1 transposase (ISmav2) [Legionella santicrucis]